MKLLDFGIAKVVVGDAASSHLAHTAQRTIETTQTGVIAGTPGYMSPEQALGNPVDTRSDVWAFGCILYEMLSGGKAFGGETLSDTVTAILHRDPDWLRLPASTPRPIRRLLQRCLEKDPGRRLASIADARHELEHVMAAGSRMWMAVARPRDTRRRGRSPDAAP